MVSLLKSQTSAGGFSNSTGSSVTDRRFSPDIQSISTVGANGCANGPHRDFWAGPPATGDAATGKLCPFTPQPPPWAQPSSEDFFTLNSRDSGNLSHLHSLDQWWQGGRSLGPGLRRKEGMCDMVSKARISARMRKISFVEVSCM